MKLFVIILVLILIIALGIAIGTQNDAIVEVNYLIAKSEVSLSIILAVSFGLGFLLAWCLCGLLYLKLLLSRGFLKRKVNKLSKEISKNEQDINKLSRKAQQNADFLISEKQTGGH